MRKCSMLPVVLVLGFASFDVFGAVVGRSVKTTSVKTANESLNNKFIMGISKKMVSAANTDSKNAKAGFSAKNSSKKRNIQSATNGDASSSVADCGYAVLGRNFKEGAYNYILYNTDLNKKLISVKGAGYWSGESVAAVQAVKSQYATHTGGCVCPSYSFRYKGQKAHFYTWPAAAGLKDINAQNDGVSINKNFACLIDTKKLDESYKIKFVFGCNASATPNPNNGVHSILYDAPKISTNDNKTDKTVASVCPAISGTTVWQCKTILDGAQHSFILDPSKSYKDNTSLREYISKYGRGDWELAATGQQWYGESNESDMIVTYCVPSSSNTGVANSGTTSSSQNQGSQSTTGSTASNSVVASGDCGGAVIGEGREYDGSKYDDYKYVINNTDLGTKSRENGGKGLARITGKGEYAGFDVASIKAIKSEYAKHTGGCVCPSYKFRDKGKESVFYTWTTDDKTKKSIKDMGLLDWPLNENFACLLRDHRSQYIIKFAFGCDETAKPDSYRDKYTILRYAPEISTNDSKPSKTVASVCPASSGKTIWQCKTILDGAQHTFILDPSKSYKDNTSLREYINKYGESDWLLAESGRQYYGDRRESEMIVTYCIPSNNNPKDKIEAVKETQKSSQNNKQSSVFGSANNKADTGTQKQNSQSTSNANGSIGSASNKSKFDAQICSWRPDHYVREKGSANLRHKKNSQEGCDGMSKGTWWTRYDNQLYEGASLCSSVNSGQPTSSDPSGSNCWCKLSPSSEWVYLISDGTSNDDWYCTAACAKQCEFWVHDSEARARLSGKVKVPAGTSVLDSIPQYTLRRTYSCKNKGTTHKTMGNYTRSKMYTDIQNGVHVQTAVDRECLVGDNKVWQCYNGTYNFELVPETEYASNKSFVDYLLSPDTTKSSLDFDCEPAAENKQNMYTVTLDTNGGELIERLEFANGTKSDYIKSWKAIGSGKYTKLYLKGEKVDGVPDARKGDEILVSWCTDKSLNNCQGNMYNLTGNTTFYAKYKKANFFAAMYNSLGWCWKQTSAKSGGWVEDTCGDMKKGSWWVKKNGKTYEGTTKCSVTEGKQNTMGKPSDTEGKHCWCKEDKASSWISSGYSSGNAEACNKWCPQECSYLSW